MIKFPWDDETKEVEPQQPHMSEEERKRMEQYVLGILNSEGNK